MSSVATLDTAPPEPGAPSSPPPTGEPFNAADWLVARHARTAPDRRAITAVDLDGSVRTLTYAELDEAVHRFAAALVASGVRPEERLLLCMADTPELLTAFLAGLHIGAVPVPVSTMLKPHDIAGLATDSRARLVALTAEFAELGTAVAGCRDVADVVVLTDDPLPEVTGARVRTWEEFV